MRIADLTTSLVSDVSRLELTMKMNIVRAILPLEKYGGDHR
jgi:hypothetical protein